MLRMMTLRRRKMMVLRMMRRRVMRLRMMRCRMVMLRMMMSRGRKRMMLRMVMSRRRKRMILRMLMRGRRADPKTAPRVLCEPAQPKVTWTFHKSHFVSNFTGKVPEPRT